MKRAPMPILISRPAGSSRLSMILISGLTIMSGSCGRWPRHPTPFGSRPLTWAMGNEYVYKELLGYDDERYERLEEEGHIGTEPAPHIP